MVLSGKILMFDLKEQTQLITKYLKKYNFKI